MFVKMKWTVRPYSKYLEVAPTIHKKQIKNKEFIKVLWPNEMIELKRVIRKSCGTYEDAIVSWNIELNYNGSTFLIAIEDLKGVKFDLM